MRFELIEPPAANPQTGGHIFNRRVMEHARTAVECQLTVVPVEAIDRVVAERTRPCVLDSIYLPHADPSVLAGDPPVLQLVHFLADRDPNIGESVRPRIDDALRAAHGAIVTSEFMAAEVTSRMGADRVRVCRPGVDPFGDRPQVAAGAARLLTVANFERRKGHLELLRCLAPLRDLAWHWDVVGDLEVDRQHADGFVREVSALGLADRVTVHGARPASFVRSRMLRADVFVLLSIEEPYGMVFAESIAAGTPVIGYRVGGIPESVQHGVTGLLVEAGDSAAVGEQLRSVLSQPELRARWTHACRAARERFPSWARAADRFVESVRELV